MIRCVTMNIWYQMWGKTYLCQISDDLSVWNFLSSMTFPWLLTIFQSSMTFHDFSRKFYFSRFSRPCGNPVIKHNKLTINNLAWLVFDLSSFLGTHLWSNNFSRKCYRKVSNIRRTRVGNKIVDHSDVVGASPVGAAPTTSSFST